MKNSLDFSITLKSKILFILKLTFRGMSGLRDMSPEKKKDKLKDFWKEKARGELPGWFLGPESEVQSEWVAYRYTMPLLVKNEIL